MDSFFSEHLIAWYMQNKRTLPWRDIQNPYFIWLSEVILQQTRVNQGLPYFLRFVERFPTVEALAEADESEVLRLWQGLGYYSRARNLHATAQIIAQHYQGIFPATYQELLKLKGIGTYTAAAIASFAFDERVAVVDGNVYRVLARYFGIHADIQLPKIQKEFAQLAKDLLPATQVNTYNQAIMEFGALHCKPVSPSCLSCVLQPQCVAFAEKSQNLLPIKEKKIKIRKRFFYYVVIWHQHKIAMRQRKSGDIWQGLYDFLLFESDKECKNVEIFDSLGINPLRFDLSHSTEEQKHLLSHQELRIKFLVGTPKDLQEASTMARQYEMQFFSIDQIMDLPKPIVIANFFEKINAFLLEL